MLDEAFWRVVDDGVAALGIALAPRVRAAIDAQGRLLLAWNEAINLTAHRSADAVARWHVLDSLSAMAACRHALERQRRRPQAAGLLDIGSGGGYPGLPLALALGVKRAGLVDSVQKKARFLGVVADAATKAMAAAREEAPTITALADRAEDLAGDPQQREKWDLVTARAVGSLAEVVELGLPLTSVGGHVIAWKRDGATQPLRAEIADARRVIQAAGGTPPTVVPVDPTGAAGLAGHLLVVIRKARNTPERYPRPPGERRRAALLG